MAASADEMINAGAKELKNPSPEQIQQAYQSLETEINHLIAKMSELDEEQREHGLVIAALEKVPEDRRCCRMVGGVLAERTVKDIKPQVVDNKAKIQKVIEQVDGTLKKKLEIRKQFVQKYSISDPAAEAKRAQAAGGESGASRSGGGGGVLV